MKILNFVLAGKVNVAMEQMRVTATQQNLNSEGAQFESYSACQTCCLRGFVYYQKNIRLCVNRPRSLLSQSLYTCTERHDRTSRTSCPYSGGLISNHFSETSSRG
jgi:hypothetical protein